MRGWYGVDLDGTLAHYDGTFSGHPKHRSPGRRQRLMKIRVISKTGDQDAEITVRYHTLEDTLDSFRKSGGYYTVIRLNASFVPFEEIKRIEKINEVNR